MDTNRTQDSRLSSDFDDGSFGAGTDNHDTDLEDTIQDVGAEDVPYAPPDTEEDEEDDTQQTFDMHIQKEREQEQQKEAPVPKLDIQSGEAADDCPIDVQQIIDSAIQNVIQPPETQQPAEDSGIKEAAPSSADISDEQMAAVPEVDSPATPTPAPEVDSPASPIPAPIVEEVTPPIPVVAAVPTPAPPVVEEIPPPAPLVAAPAPLQSPSPPEAQPQQVKGLGGLPKLPPKPAGLGSGLPPKHSPKLPPTQPAPASAPAAASSPPQAPATGSMPSLPSRPQAAAAQRPAPGLGGMPSLPNRPAAQAGQVARALPGGAVVPDEEAESDDIRHIRKFVHGIRVLLIRSMRRINFPMSSNFARQVITRLDYIERLRVGQAGGPASGAAQQRAQEEADRLEQADPNGALDLEITILFIGQKGSGKSSTINSLLGLDPMDRVYANKDDNSIQVLEGVLNGIKLRCIDTPGLSPSASAIGQNQRKLVKIKAATKRYKPDAVLYVDRMDLMRRNMGDLPLLRQVSDTLGVSTLFNTLLVLTHANITPPEGRDGPLNYETYLNQRAYMLQQTMRSATQDMRLINPVFAAENHPSARDEQTGQLLLPTGNPWVNELMAGCITTKMLYLVDKELKLNSNEGNQQSTAFISRFLRGGAKIPPLPYLLSNMVQPKGPRKYPEEERDIRNLSEIKRMEGEAGKEALRKRREYLKQRADEVKQGEAQVAVPAPEPPLPPSFVVDYPSHKYRYLERQTGWIARPMVEQAGLDHQDGVEGAHFEKQAVLRPHGQYLGGAPAFMMAQFKKDKGDMTAHIEAESSTYLTNNLTATAGVQMQTVSEDMLYQLHVEPRLKIHPKDKISMGLVWARLGEDRKPGKGPVAVGLRVENRYRIKKGVKVIAAAGRMGCKTRFATEKGWAASSELRMKGGARQQSEFSLGGSAMKFRKELALGMNVAAQHTLTEDTTGTVRLSLNTKGTGSLAVRLTSHDQHALAYTFLLPIVGWVVNTIRGGEALEGY